MNWRARAASVLLSTCLPWAAQAADDIAPYKMVRSLQIVQDQIANGDHASLPMQQKLLELTDARFRSARKEDFDDPRNLSALLVWAMSGGNPTTVEVALSRLDLKGDDAVVGKGVLAYMRGQLVQAGQILDPIDPMTRPDDTGAFIALVKGSIIGGKFPGPALRLMDQARLLAPGTLVEEAALRRSLPLVLTMRRPDRFLRLAEQYTRRFLRSPYASEFADAFVEGLVTFHDDIDEKQIDTIVSLMTPAQQEAIYLRLARRSTIKGQIDRSAFASEKARKTMQGTEQGADPRAMLYQAIASITSENIEEVLARLKDVDPGELSPRDRRLLLAARAIAAEVLAPPAAPEPPAAGDEAATAAADAAAEPAANRPAQPAQQTLPAGLEELAAEAGAVAADQTESNALMTSVRSKLDEVDRLLSGGKPK
ncbi:MAG: chemotaxis protein MotC [Mesorhizobium sp.]